MRKFRTRRLTRSPYSRIRPVKYFSGSPLLRGPNDQRLSPVEGPGGNLSFARELIISCYGRGTRSSTSGVSGIVGSLRANCAQTIGAAFVSKGHARKSSRLESLLRGIRRHRHKRAADMPNAIQPSILNLNRKKHTPGSQHAKYLCKRAFLRFSRFQVMQHENGNRRGKCFFRKRQCRRVALQNNPVSAVAALSNSYRERVAVLETRHSRRALPQLFRRSARSRANFQDVRAQFRSRQNPRKQMLSRHGAPERRSAKPALEPIHKSTSIRPHKKSRRAFLKENSARATLALSLKRFRCIIFQDLIIAGWPDNWLLEKTKTLSQHRTDSPQRGGKLVSVVRGRIFQLAEKLVDSGANLVR